MAQEFSVLFLFITLNVSNFKLILNKKVKKINYPILYFIRFHSLHIDTFNQLVQLLSRAQLFAIPWTAAHRASL